MKPVFRILIAFSLILFGFQSHAQLLKKDLDQVYGLNPHLYNGKLYSGSYGQKVSGHQFLEGSSFKDGSAKVLGENYTDLQLNYDIYLQKIILKFETSTGASSQIEIPQSHIQSFQMEGQFFQLFQENDSTYKIYQLIGKPNHQILIYWYKKLVPITSTNQFEYEFQDAKKEIFLLVKGKLNYIKNNKSLIKMTDSKDQHLLKKWIKTHHFKIYKAHQEELLSLSQFLNSL